MSILVRLEGIIMSNLKVAMVTPEYYGRAMVGGVAMVASGLTKALRKKGADVRVVMPRYASQDKYDKYLGQPPADLTKFGIERVSDGNVPIYEVTGLAIGAPYTYANKAPAMEIQNVAYRAQGPEAFSIAFLWSNILPTVLKNIAEQYDWTPDVVHLHGWFNAAASYALRQNDVFKNTPSVITSHNGFHPGLVPFSVNLEVPDKIEEAPIKERTKSVLATPEDFFASLLEMGIFYADGVTTVSPSYAQELLVGQTPIDSRVVRRMKERGLVGILNL